MEKEKDIFQQNDESVIKIIIRILRWVNLIWPAIALGMYTGLFIEEYC